ncbi:MAG TPA: hypothetical protein ENK43_04385 [Planctomycetes bacterium]|nr:hypothetical protein [Planctomycetota bacterium]
MGAITEFGVWSRIGKQADRTTKAASFVDLALRKDGLTYSASKESEKLDSEHRFKGNQYRVFTQRNAEPGQLQTWIFPDSVGTFFDAVFTDTNGLLGYFNVEHYWDATLNSSAGSQDVGTDLQGIIFNGASFTIERGNTANSLELDLEFFQNAKVGFDSTVTKPAYTAPPLDPYVSTDVLIDFRGNNATDSYGGDNADVRSVGLQYTSNVELRNFRPSTTARYNKSWTNHFIQEPSLTVTVEIEVADDNYLRYDEGSALIEGSLRLAARHPSASMITTTTETITAGATGVDVITMADATGAEVGDVIVFIHPTTGFFCTLTATVVAVNDVSFDRDAQDSYVTMDGLTGGPIAAENMSWGVIVPRMTLTSATPPKSNGSVRTMQFTYEADLQAGETSLLVPMAYDHSASHA